MSKNLTRKGLALATALSFGLTGLTATAPAYAAAGDVVSIEPTTGTGWGSYDTDSFSVTTKIADSVTDTAAQKLAIEISNPNSYDVTVAITGDTDITSYTLTNPDEEYAAVTTTGAAGVSLDAGSVTIDFSDVSDKNYTHAVINLETVVVGDDILAAVSVANGDGSGTGITATTYDLGTDTASIGFTSFIDSDEDKARTAADTNQSKTETIKFYDPTKVTVTPRVERFVSGSSVYLNDVNDAALGFSVGFSPAINIDQLDIDVAATDGFDVGTTDTLGETWVQRKPFGSADYGFNGRLYGTITMTVTDAAHVVYGGYTGGTAKASSSFKPLKQSALTGAVGEITIWAATDPVTAPAANSSFGTLSGTTPVDLRSGAKSIAYTAHADEARANVPVFAVVSADVVATGSSLTAGTKKLADDESALISGVTNADGEYTLTVESGLAKKGESYSVTFYVINSAGTAVATSKYTSTYVASEPTTVAAVSKVLSGSTVNAKFSVKDQFDQATSVTAAGKALYVELTRSSEDVKKYVAVTAGVAAFSFANTLVKGDSEGLTAQLGTGGANKDDFEPISGKSDSAEVYNPEATAEISVNAEISTKEITYGKFITGAVSATNEAPVLDDAIDYSGTVVDTAGAGIPGAVVTVSGAGLQFQEDANGDGDATTADDGDFYKDSITVAAGTDGTFNLSIWAHKITTKGITITVTSGGKSATTKLTTTSNDNVSADDLAFTWDAPKHPGVDVTYITTVKLTDKWGNPISGARITVDAAGALLINGDDTVTKTTSASGVVRVYFRSLTKTDGVANITATLEKVVIAGITLDNDSATGSPTLDITAGETFENVISADVTVGPDAAAVAGKKAGTAKVTAYNSKGKTVTVYVAGKKVATKKATSSSYSFTVKAKAGAVVKVKVGTSTFFNASVN